MRKSIWLALPLVGALSLTGCSNFTFPWDENLLDPGRIVTREPLEVPPDMDALPGAESAEDSRMNLPGEGEKRAGKDGSRLTSARSILFNTPPPPESKPLGREEQEKLPGWLAPAKGAK